MCLGIPGRIIEIREEEGLRMGTVDFGGVRREVCLAYLDEDTSMGDFAIIHAGFAIAKVDEAEAERTFQLLREMGELEVPDGHGEGTPPGGDAPSVRGERGPAEGESNLP